MSGCCFGSWCFSLCLGWRGVCWGCSVQKLLTLWGMVDSKYGPWVAGLVVLAIIGIAYSLHLTPAQVFQWLGW